MMENFNIATFMMSISALILGITVHEWAHAISADKLGDSTPRSQGRVTLWPLAHLDPMGTILMVVSTATGFGFGWGKPVMTQPANYRINPRIGDSLVSVAGPISNLVLAFFFAFVLRLNLLAPDDPFHIWLQKIVLINVVLFCFNLIPVYPLDGSHLLANALPVPMAESYRKFMAQFGVFIFLGLVLSGVLSKVMLPAVAVVYQFLLYSGN
jgi:Zn-dependent protease